MSSHILVGECHETIFELYSSVESTTIRQKEKEIKLCCIRLFSNRWYYWSSFHCLRKLICEFHFCTCFVIATYPLVFFRCTTSSSAELPHFWSIFFYHGRAKQKATSTCTSHVLENKGATQCTTSLGTAPSIRSSKWSERSFLLFLRVSEKAQQGSLSYISIKHLSIMTSCTM